MCVRQGDYRCTGIANCYAFCGGVLCVYWYIVPCVYFACGKSVLGGGVGGFCISSASWERWR